MRKLQETDTDNVHSCGIVYPEVYLYIKRISAIIPILELEAVFKSCSLVEDKPCSIDTETKLIVNATLSFVSYIFEIIFPNLYCNYCTLPSYAFHNQYSERNVNNLPGCYFMDDDCMMLFLPAAGRRWHDGESNSREIDGDYYSSDDFILSFSRDYAHPNGRYGSADGNSIRCVRE